MSIRFNHYIHQLLTEQDITGYDESGNPTYGGDKYDKILYGRGPNPSEARKKMVDELRAQDERRQQRYDDASPRGKAAMDILRSSGNIDQAIGKLEDAGLQEPIGKIKSDIESGERRPVATPPDLIGGFPNIGGIVPKPGTNPGQSEYTPPAQTQQPPREEEKEQPTPRQVRSGPVVNTGGGSINFSGDGTVVGAQGVGNQVTQTGDITIGDAPTPRERREQQKKPVKATPPKDTQQGGGWLGWRARDGSAITPDTEWADTPVGPIPIGKKKKFDMNFPDTMQF